MKKLINTIRNKVALMKRTVENAIVSVLCKTTQTKAILANRSGEAYLDMIIKILLCVVLGALLLAGLYALFGDLVMPTLTRRIQEMFDYAG